MTVLLYRTGRFCARHARLVTILWVVGAFLLIVAGNRLGAGSNDAISVNGTDSTVAQTLLNREFPAASGDPSRVVLSVASGTLRDDARAKAVHDSAEALRRVPGVSAVGDPLADGSAAITGSGRIGYLGVTTAAGRSTAETAQRVLAAMAPASAAGIDVAVGGQLGQQLSRSPVRRSELIGIVMAVIVMLLAFGSAVAMGVPIITAVLSVGGGLAMLKLIGNVVDLPDVAATLATMIGLGVGIDYGLFLVARFRRLLAHPMSVEEAVGRTSGSSGSAVLFAACTVIVAVCGLGFSGVSFVGWLGYSAAVVVAVSLLSAITLTPALLGWLGPRINRLALPGRRGAQHAGAEQLDATAWARLAGKVARRPWTTTLVSTAILLGLAAPVLFLRLGQMDAGQLPPTTQSRRAYDLLATGFGPGANGPLRVVVELYQPAAAPKDAKPAIGTDPRTLDPRLVTLGATLGQTPGVRAVGTPVISPDAAVAVYAVTQTYSPSDARTVHLVALLRGEVLPAALAGQGAEGHVGGLTATKSDLAARIAQRLPWLILGVVALACLLMLLAFRSIWLAVKAAVLNLISIAAAYGVVVAVFQWGWGIRLIGLDGPVPIESYVPMMMFAILFGLSMDYEVFLLSSVQEHWHATGDNTRAVRLGLADTGQIISSAALIMVSVFGSFLINNSPIVKMFGLGLSVAVAVDATIVRCLLVPAVMVLFGRRQWQLPPRLDAVLPRIAIDPDPAVFDAYARGSGPAPTDHRAAAGGHAPGGGLVSAVLLGLAVVGSAVAAGSVAPAVTIAAPLLLGALVAAISTAVPAGLRRTTVVALGIGSSPLSRVVGLCLGLALAALAAAVAASRFPAVPSAAGLTLGLTFLLAAVPAAVTRNRIPLTALWAAAAGFTVVGTLSSALADGTPAPIGSVAARVLLWSAVGFVLVGLGELLARQVPALVRRATTRRSHRAGEAAELAELFDRPEETTTERDLPVPAETASDVR